MPTIKPIVRRGNEPIPARIVVVRPPTPKPAKPPKEDPR
jgi:hypothetical protein